MRLVIDENCLVNFSTSGNCSLSTHYTTIQKIKMHISAEFNFRTFSFPENLHLRAFAVELFELFH